MAATREDRTRANHNYARRGADDKRAGAKEPEMNTHVAGGMTIGPASLDDLDAIEALETAAFSGDRLSRRSLRAFIRGPRRPLIVARFGDRIAGYALLSTRAGGRSARIYSLAVDPAQGRRGVGRALLQACERYARGHGLEALRLEVRYDNPTAIALYEKFGFRSFGHCPGYYEDGAAALRFEKRLAPAAEDAAA